MTDMEPEPETIERLGSTVHQSFAMLAGMQLDVFTPLKDGPMGVEEIAGSIGVGAPNSGHCSMRSFPRGY
jgi:hypothetical protein